MHGRDGQTRSVTRNGEELLESVPYASDTIQNRLDIIRNKWERLRDNSGYRKKKLQENVKLQQFIAEYNDIESWLDITKRVVENDDLGYDEHSAEALIKKHQVKCLYSLYQQTTANVIFVCRLLKKTLKLMHQKYKPFIVKLIL